MATALYKPGQGYWTRLVSAVSLGVIVLMGAKWTMDQFVDVRIMGQEPVVAKALAFTLVATVFAVLGYWLIARHQRMVDFMIAVESEMKKVNWSSRREIVGSTWVVIGLTVFLSLMCFGFDLLFKVFFTQIGVLE